MIFRIYIGLDGIFVYLAANIKPMFSKRNIIRVLLLVSVCFPTYGQSDMFLSQQWFSRINFNPAATGNSNNVDIFLLNRQQWADFDNAPQTSVLNAHSYFSGIRSGLGLSVVYDKIGLSRQTVNALFAYAYHFNLGEQTLLSLGLSGGIYNTNWDPNKNIIDVENDPEMQTERTSRLNADFDAGVELNTHGLIVGAAVTHISGTDPDDSYTGKPSREYYGYARYNLALGRVLDLAPGVIYRYANRTDFFDLNLTAFFVKKYWVGLSFRPDNAFAAMLGLELGMFRVGYAYDHSIGKTASLATNSHEVMLSIRIRRAQTNKKTPRFFD